MKKFEVYKIIKQRQSPAHRVKIVKSKKKISNKKVDWRQELANS